MKFISRNGIIWHTPATFVATVSGTTNVGHVTLYLGCAVKSGKLSMRSTWRLSDPRLGSRSATSLGRVVAKPFQLPTVKLAGRSGSVRTMASISGFFRWDRVSEGHMGIAQLRSVKLGLLIAISSLLVVIGHHGRANRNKRTTEGWAQ